MANVAIPLQRHQSGQRPDKSVSRGSAADKINVGDSERWLSLAGGSLLALHGLHEQDLVGLGLAVLGGSLVYRGLSGHCPAYHALNISTKEHSLAAAVPAGRGIKVVQALIIQKPAEELYRQWRNFDNLPSFVTHLVSVQSQGNRSHWIANAPMGMSVEWDAEIVNDEPNRLIAWRSLSGSQVATAGSVHFTPLSDMRGTEVRVELKYDPPGGQLGSWVAWAFGQDPRRQIREDLRRFKQLMETGEIASVEGQPSCR